MIIKINTEGNLEISLQDIFRSMSPESKIALIEDLSCESAIIKHVTDQIIYGFTENYSSGATQFPVSINPTGLDYARREIAKCASNIAKEEINRLEESIKILKDELHESNLSLWEERDNHRRY